MKVFILGAGSFGCALSDTLVDAGNEVTVWTICDKQAKDLTENHTNINNPEVPLNSSIKFTTSLDYLNDCDIVLIVVPSFALRETCKKINETLLSEKIIVVATKGLEADTMKSGHDIIKEEVKLLKASVILSGPTHAEELALKMFTSIVSTSENKEARDIVQKNFATKYLRIYTNSDVPGVEILGASKNVLAIAAGFIDGSKSLGDNAKAALLTRGLRELRILGEVENCNSETFYGLTGLGDLIVTATSKHSRNRKFGELLGQGMSVEDAKEEVGMVVEGLYSVQAIHQLMKKNNLDLPIIGLIYRAIYESVSTDELLSLIHNRQTKDEY